MVDFFGGFGEGPVRGQLDALNGGINQNAVGGFGAGNSFGYGSLGGDSLSSMAPLLAALGSAATQRPSRTSVVADDASSAFGRAESDIAKRIKAQILLSQIFPGQADFSGLAGSLNEFGRGPGGEALSLIDLIKKRDAASAIPEIKNLGGGGGGGDGAAIGSLLGTGVGAYFGGPAGASIGGSLGGAFGGMF